MNKNTKIYGLLFLLTLLGGVPVLSFAQTQVVNGQGIMTSPGNTEFLIYTPPGYVEGTPSPLLINLHGQGQINPNPQWPGCFSIECLRSQANDATPAYLIHQGQWPTTRPFIVVSPQLKRDATPNIADQDWSAPYIDEVIEYVKTIRTINPDKIYIMGLSLGGQGCMIYSAAYPNKVAAMVPICGRTDDIIQDGMACSLVNIPMWIFHGTEDITLNYTNAINMEAAINACPNPGSIKPHVTLLDAGEHTGISVWNPIYNLACGYPVYDWLLKFTKNSTANVLPYVNVGTDKKFLVSDSTIYLFAEYFDPDGSIASVAWTQTQGTALTLQQTNTHILKITNLQAGTFQFRLTVTDNLGGISTDDVTVQLFDTSALNSVTSLRLINTTNNNADIGILVNDQVINKNTLNTNKLNVRAVLTNPSGSIVFKVNSNQNTRLIDENPWSPPHYDNVYVYNQTYAPAFGWNILTGDHVVCVTPYTGGNGSGTEGISKCIKFSVINPIIQNYYPRPGLDLSALLSWGANPPDGSGSSPAYFNHSTGSNFQVFNVNKAATQSGPLSIGGNESALWVRNGGEMTVNDTFTGVINVEGNGIVNVNTTQPVAFGSVSPTSTVRFGTDATAIPAHTYGNVEIMGAGTKTLSSGATIITGNLVIGNNVVVNGAANNTSVIQLTGNLILQEDSEFNPAHKFGLTFSGGQPHAITLAGAKAVFSHLTILGSSEVTVAEGTVPKTFEFGTSTGGGLLVEAGSELNLGKNHLTITGAGTINSQNQTGKISFDQSTLAVTSGSAFNSNLYTQPTRDTVAALVTNLTGSGALFLRDSLFVLDSVKNYNGILHANGLLTLVSSANKTASIGRVEGTGNITGDIRFQRFIRPGRMYRYLSFPVQNATVSDLQNYIPVTGTFEGNSPGTTNPSLFHYQEPAGWIPYPTTSHTENFALGKGYAAYIRKSTDPTLVKLAGEIHIGDFSFQLNDGAVNDQSGWSLLGNPYAAPIQWGNAGWISSGINATAYLRDNEYENGRFLVWDGEEGDEEFAGLIAQGQSFWVKAFDPNLTPSLTVQETAKANTQATLYRTKEESNSNLIISLNHNDLTDRTFLKFNDRSGLKFDPQHDGLKQQNSYYNLSSLSSDLVSVSIKNLPDSCYTNVALAVTGVKAGAYSLQVSGSALDGERVFFLNDIFLDSLVQVNADQDYTFHVTDQPQSYGTNRFRLMAITELPDPVITADETKLISNVASGNQWLLNGKDIEGATEQTYVPLESGDYQVRVVASLCSKVSPPFIYLITGTEPQNQIKIYPNPAQQHIMVTGLSAPAHYTLQNMWGQTIQAGSLSVGQTEIELHQTASGLYILSLELESGVQRYKLIIKK
ncbi:MAG: T9SS type A sorting domain-containing protein [Cyclobacteriaceae bacterium]|nr:T9SS type A sorting domain-containing protein [Cyclobacteriaceae bacterium]